MIKTGNGWRRALVALVISAVAVGFISGPADAANRKPKAAAKTTQAGKIAQAPKANAREAAIVINARTGQILYQKNADALRYPASLTKMMTIYMTFEAMQKGRLTFESRIPVSARAAGMAPTKLGLRAGGTVSVRDAVLGLMTKSANDAAAALAEHLGGTEARFAEMMTAKARSLGMNNTNFHNASGLPDPLQRTTARDMATLSLHLQRDFPEHYHMFATRAFTFAGVVQRNHNRLLGQYPGADGLKTGFIRASGFNLAASARRGDTRLIGVVFGGSSGPARDRQMMTLLDYGFAHPSVKADGALMADSQDLENRIRLASVEEPNSRAIADETAEGDAGESDTAPLPDAVTSEPLGQIASAIEPATAAAADSAQTTDALAASTLAALARQQPVSETARPARTTPPARVAALPPAAAPAQAARGGWMIQVGAFAKENAARNHAKAVVKLAPTLLGGRDTSVIRTAGKKPVFKVTVAGFDQAAARKACAALQKKKMGCMVMAVDAG